MLTEEQKDRKYLYGVFKRFKKRYPKLTFTEFEREITREDFDEKKFHQRLQKGSFSDWM